MVEFIGYPDCCLATGSESEKGWTSRTNMSAQQGLFAEAVPQRNCCVTLSLRDNRPALRRRAVKLSARTLARKAWPVALCTRPAFLPQSHMSLELEHRVCSTDAFACSRSRVMHRRGGCKSPNRQRCGPSITCTMELSHCLQSFGREQHHPIYQYFSQYLQPAADFDSLAPIRSIGT